MRISDWSSDVCSSDLGEYPGALLWPPHRFRGEPVSRLGGAARARRRARRTEGGVRMRAQGDDEPARRRTRPRGGRGRADRDRRQRPLCRDVPAPFHGKAARCGGGAKRSEEHTSELQSLMRISYAVFCLKKKNATQPIATQMTI